MKKYYYFFTIIILIGFASTLQSQNWRKATERSFPNVNDMFFITNMTGWTCSDDGQIRKTTDAGVTWAASKIDTLDLNAICFADQNIGFTGGEGQKVFKTTDGGINWSGIPVTQINGNIVAIHFKDSNIGWIAANLSSNSQILRTTDGGQTWSEVLSVAKIILDIAFYGNKGIASTSKLEMFYSADGVTWNPSTNATLPAGYTRSDIRGVSFADENTAYAVGWGSLIGLQSSILLKSTNGGANWTYLTQANENKVYDNLYAVYFKDATNGVAFGGASKGTIGLRTNDGGTNWIPVNVPCGVTINSVCGFGDHLYIGGNSGVIMHSTDFGSTWHLYTKIPAANLYSIHSANDYIYSAGYNALFIRSLDGGQNWISSFVRANNVSPHVNDLFFVNENIGYAAHSYGLVSKTTDGGNTWLAVRKDTNAVAVSMTGVHFVNENLGFVVGKIASNVDVIYKTTDGGLTWTSKENQLASNPTAVAFKDANTGIVVSEKLGSLYTVDGGTTWTLSQFVGIPPGTTSHLRDVTFKDNNTAVAVGDGLILISNDAGATWSSSVTGLQQGLYGVDFKDANYGWATGSKNSAIRSTGLYLTTDGGNSWNNKVETAVFDTMISLYQVTNTSSGFTFVGAASGVIYTNAPLSNIQEDINNPNRFVLNQNYPNPFNPSTVISWVNPVSENIKLEIFNIMGEKIATLVDEYKEAGFNSFNFSAEKYSLTSGVYFYCISGKNTLLTKKMLLIK